MSSPTLFSTRSRVRFLAAAGLGLAAGGFRLGNFALAQESTPAAEVSITMSAIEFSFDIPDQIPSGWVRVTMENKGAEAHHAQFLKLADGVTADDFQNTLLSEGEAALATVLAYGGAGVIDPGSSSEAIVWLDPGDYVAVCFVSGADNVPHFAKGMLTPFSVVEGDGTSQPPVEDAAVELIDFGFKTLPAEFPAGKVTIKATNSGTEMHELTVLSPIEGVTVDEIIAMFSVPPASPESEATMDHGDMATPAPEASGPPPFHFNGGLQGIMPGMTGYAVLDLAPGEYIALCGIPSPANGGAPHFMLGMTATFTVK
jgi:hypothetical protein